MKDSTNYNISLHGEWNLTSNKFDQTIKGIVPGSVYQDLLQANIIPDPFDQDNEYLVREFMNYDYSYERVFWVEPKHLANHKNFLVCKGIDTLGEIYINGLLVSKTNNMHRSWRFDVSEYLQTGENIIKITLKSCLEYIAKKEEACPYNLLHISDGIRGYIHLRKGSSMFGWDWGPQLPDAGIWRDIYIESIALGYIEDVMVTQTHQKDSVLLDVHMNTVLLQKDVPGLKLKIDFIISSNETATLYEAVTTKTTSFTIDTPQKWYPVGYGDQPLYTVAVSLMNDDQIIQTKEVHIGLREIELKQERDDIGESFTVVVNGIEVFAKGANYIPEDNLLGRNTYEKTKDLLQSAVETNHNMVRVWGGGIYPEDYFYQLCDELGLLVWQDLMFACSVYDMNDTEFVDTMKQEIIDNMIRIRNHPSIALICGNNEVETAIEGWNVPSLELSKEFYITQYMEILPTIVKEYFPNIPYWKSSPASVELFQNSNSDTMGDMHYWGVWHANEPITYYRNYLPRFMSEFGLQSFPELKTIQTFAREEDMNIFSYIMEQHQKNKSSNSKILNYVGKMFKYPKDFSSLLYLSQLIQAEGIRYGSEHWRRNYGRCMGILYWQLNDCWPVASWSSIDYYHRWKALHYASKKFYQPILVSIEETETKANIYITNDTLNPVSGHIKWELLDLTGQVLQSNSKRVTIHGQCAECFYNLAFELDLKSRMNKVLYVFFEVNTKIISENQVSFVPDKYLLLENPQIDVSIVKQNECFEVILDTNTYAKFVELSIEDEDVVFSDNFIHLIPNKIAVISVKSTLSLEQIRSKLRIRTLYDTYETIIK